VANFDPEFTETDLGEVALIPGFEGNAGQAHDALEAGGILSVSAQARKDAAASNGVAISKDAKRVPGSDADDALTSSVQDKFRGFSYSGTYDGSVAGSMGTSFGGRRGSGGLAGASLSMSRMQVDDGDDEQLSPSDVPSFNADAVKPEMDTS
jgi:protein-serine/threonine kinase